MILTDKCLEDFRKYISFHYGLDLNDWEVNKKVFQNALIVEFFDKNNIFITSKPSEPCANIVTWQYSIRNYQNTPYRFPDRFGAYTEAIIKANIIYNEKFK